LTSDNRTSCRTCRHSVVDIISRLIEAMRRLGAGERVMLVASRHRSGFERPQQGTADAAKSCSGRHIIQHDLACVRHESHPEDGIALDGEQERASTLRSPCGHRFAEDIAGRDGIVRLSIPESVPLQRRSHSSCFRPDGLGEFQPPPTCREKRDLYAGKEKPVPPAHPLHFGGVTENC